MFKDYSLSTQTSVDCWYGINGYDILTDMTAGPPCRRVDPSNLNNFGKMSQVLRASEMVFFFDGLYLDHTHVNANRLNARHARQTQTNLGFFDGHAANYLTASLPGGLGNAPTSTFTIGNLRANYPPPANPMWLMEQQQD